MTATSGFKLTRPRVAHKFKLTAEDLLAKRTYLNKASYLIRIIHQDFDVCFEVLMAASR